MVRQNTGWWDKLVGEKKMKLEFVEKIWDEHIRTNTPLHKLAIKHKVSVATLDRLIPKMLIERSDRKIKTK